MLPEHPAVLAEWKRLVRQYGVSGVETYDARLVAAMKAHGVGHLLTFDKDDFKRYVAAGEIATIDPATV